MKLMIDCKKAVPGSLLHLKVAGFSIDVSDVSGFEKVVVTDHFGNVSIEVSRAGEDLLPSPVPEKPYKGI